ncbi:MAG TPA: FAD-binding oxidoreductase [Burkholderiales bacterium]|nr:FAD-binding oxidoreductase [Burkholderiales bacterium]
MSEKWLTGRVIENRHWTETLFSLRVEGVRLSFQAGQFVRIALEIDGQRVARAFSFVNPADDPVLEFYGVIVPEGPLSPRLAKLKAGDALYVAQNPAGFLVLSEVPDAETLWLVATGTGLAPFLSILRTEAPWRRFKNVVLVHAVRYANELTYKEVIRRTAVRYVTFVSREPVPGALAGRIPAAIADGRLESAAGLPLTPQSSHVMLCGNPQMLRDAAAALAARGMRKHRRRAPGHITVESFW